MTTSPRSALQLKKGGDVDGAIDAYNRALGHYDSEKIALPPDVDCAYGAALAAGKAKKEHAELGARVLLAACWRCRSARAARSGARRPRDARRCRPRSARARPNGLADVYLTRAPAGPSTDKLTVTVAANPAGHRQDVPADPRKLAEPDMKNALVACWDAYNAATHKEVLAVSLGMKSAVHPVGVRGRAGVFTTSSTRRLRCRRARSERRGCVRAASSRAQGLALKDAFTTKLTITIK